MAVVLLVLGCQGGAPTAKPAAVEDVPPARSAAVESPEPPKPSATTTVALRFDETAQHGDLRLSLLDLQDSRCPHGVQCFWEGQVTARIEASRSDSTSEAAEQVELVLRAGVEPEVEAAVGHAFRLLRVAPYPREGVTPERGEHEATLEIDQL